MSRVLIIKRLLLYWRQKRCVSTAAQLGSAKPADQPNPVNDTERITNIMRKLVTDTGPTEKQQGIGLVDPEVEALRQKAQSSPWVKQVISGARQCTFSGLYMPKDLLLRVKQKTAPLEPNSKHRNLLCVDELQHYSVDTGKSSYLPLTAQGVFASATDPSLKRVLADIGWVRPDIVEHCSRVLRLRAVSDMHRAHIEYFSHCANVELKRPIVIPEKGTTFGKKLSRLDVIRLETNRRVMHQDTMWRGSSPFIDLSGLGVVEGKLLAIDTVLPANGLQCIIELPAVPFSGTSTKKYSASSEAHAQAVWQELHKLVNEDPSELNEVGGVLTQLSSWKAFAITGRPQTHDEPTISTQALGSLYAHLPRLTPETMHISSISKGKTGKKASKKFKQQMEQAAVSHLEFISAQSSTTEQPNSNITSNMDICFKYSLSGPGNLFASVDGEAKKSVPVYKARDIFGLAVASTVIPWLLHMPLATTSGDGMVGLEAEDLPLEERHSRFVGIVALPCTTQLATQLHRVVSNVQKL
ncbi:hypothetical protein GGI25_003265 [Coemansia spiralis]|uniref:Uncharacterized protein n=2 Tax=Coemansia TaxID=4863 RepID=A0A9W8G8Y3_9FUNG|nr:hypothetical protein EDC05_004328 [Coemansia umbellata]KAJ2621491.1 hypothetical protein GGI26_004070 [Coemansia sp. RSA 1358]KAJ2677169.1 hypothetical protein GGI25_003265 [Coemansia spiralis]